MQMQDTKILKNEIITTLEFLSLDSLKLLSEFVAFLRLRIKAVSQPAVSERERTVQILGEAGLLTELGPNLRRWAYTSTATLEEVMAGLDKATSQSLSEIVLEQRRAKAW